MKSKTLLTIKYNPKNWALAFTYKGALLKKLLFGLIFVTALSSVLYILEVEDIVHFHLSSALPGYMGAALGLLLVFRNNTAYDKWWEARKEMGALVNISRNFAISINGLLPKDSDEKYKIANLLIGFIFSLKEHLRNGVKMEQLKDIAEEDMKIISNANHKPAVIANIIMNRIEGLWQKGLITDIQQYLLIGKVNTLIDILGKCERIRNTPIPMAYGFLLKFFIYVYVILLPLGLAENLTWWAVPLAGILYYILMSIVLTAEEIEEPFGHDLNDLAMDDMANRMKSNILEIVKHD
ncbi:MAG: bestrophin family protein [Cytophagaceae bacterium]